MIGSTTLSFWCSKKPDARSMYDAARDTVPAGCTAFTVSLHNVHLLDPRGYWSVDVRVKWQIGQSSQVVASM